MTKITFTFQGHAITAKTGQSLAAALTKAGHRNFRETAKSAERGMFCGMGVCQDCLVTVDGKPNVRACMSPAKDGMTVTRQVPFPAFTGSAPPPSDPLHLTPDVLVIGGGAGGLSAAIAAAKAGARVVILDERKVAGGQYYKQSADGSVLDAQQGDGADLVAAAVASGAEILSGVEIWGAFDPLLFLAQQGETPIIARPNMAIVATGAYERPVMVPGWTLPGVMTTGAAQTLWRSYGTLPGQRVAICGSGPLNLQVALELTRGGGRNCATGGPRISPRYSSARRAGYGSIGADVNPKGSEDGTGPAAYGRGGSQCLRFDRSRQTGWSVGSYVSGGWGR